ncbi:hypothetical protein [Clostridium sp. Cult2]|uniref:hypothetical protein n=1 Tax=Clostridium sp. Cult2 TaxID=2079003 RepID=UPI001F4907BA|nr:hypothetical protein [Clostridium sp. Cult2]MCF6465097.1 hypothetical protein [Clostridium sp. Cult2]
MKKIYGLHCFTIKGAYPALTVYFRPMSLIKYKIGEKDIAPVLTSDMIHVSVNGNALKVYLLNKVKEFIGDGNITAYLMQISYPTELLEKDRNFLHIHLIDEGRNIGEASLYF